MKAFNTGDITLHSVCVGSKTPPKCRTIRQNYAGATNLTQQTTAGWIYLIKQRREKERSNVNSALNEPHALRANVNLVKLNATHVNLPIVPPHLHLKRHKGNAFCAMNAHTASKQWAAFERRFDQTPNSIFNAHRKQRIIPNAKSLH